MNEHRERTHQDVALPPGACRYTGLAGHPRLWLKSEEVVAFCARVEIDRGAYGFDRFCEDSVWPFLADTEISEPPRYPENIRTIPLWRQMYTDCQRLLRGIRNLAIAGTILNDHTLISQAKSWVVGAARWDVEGSTSRDYNDEAAFRVAQALAWGYDWLHAVLSPQERALVRDALRRRTEQVAVHVMQVAQIRERPFNSHAVRAVSSVLIPCCLALYEEGDVSVREWLDYAVDYMAYLYPPWGGEDGGWAEGPHYWTTGIGHAVEALHWLRKATGLNLFDRPFFQHTGDFPLYVFSPDTRRASFGDQAQLGDFPGHKTASIMRYLASVTGNGHYQWYYESVIKGSVRHPRGGGWWDAAFDDLIAQHDLPVVAPQTPSDTEIVKWFTDVGWVAFHHHMDFAPDHVLLLTKSSPFGSLSHSHADQNSFVLHAYGDPLIIESGYYIGFGSSMHRDWRKQTIAHNTLLIGGQGQYAGPDEVLARAAAGRVEAVSCSAEVAYARCNATAAYVQTVPHLTNCVREFYVVLQQYIVIVDTVELTRPDHIDWLAHALSPFAINGQSFQVSGKAAQLTGTFVYSSSGNLRISQHNEFTSVDSREVQGLAAQWHLSATTQDASHHSIVVLLAPDRIDHLTTFRVQVAPGIGDVGVDVEIESAASGYVFRLHCD